MSLFTNARKNIPDEDLLHLESISTHQLILDARGQRERLEARYHEAILSVREAENELQKVQLATADKLARGEEFGNEVEKARQALAAAQGRAETFELAVKNVKEHEAETVDSVHSEVEQALKNMYAQAAVEFYEKLQETSLPNDRLLQIFNKACALLGPGQHVLPILWWRELISDPREDSKLLAWTDFTKKAGFL